MPRSGGQPAGQTGRYIIGLAGYGPAMRLVADIFERKDFLRAFPRVKIAGWVPGVHEPAGDLPPYFISLPTFKSLEDLFASRPGLDMFLDFSEDNVHAQAARTLAPQGVTIVTAGSIVQFCGAAGDGRLAIAGGEGIRKAQSMFNLLMDQVEYDVIILDERQIILEMNLHAAESRGLDRAEFLGRPCSDLDPDLPCLGQDKEDCAFCSTRQSGVKTELSVKKIMANGTVRHLQTMCFPIMDDDSHVSQYLLVNRDVTDSYHMVQKLQHAEKMAAIGELSTYMAHEIRNPLFSIGGFANALLRNPSLDEQGQEKARIIYEESRRLDAILTNILNFARPTRQEMNLFSIRPIIEQTVGLLSMGSSQRGLRVQVDIDDDLPKVEGNAENLKQCLINLMKNALEAMPDGGDLRIRAHCGENGVFIDIADTGIGIPPELQDQIFSPFFSTKKEGAGLGLAMVHKIIQEMGGQLHFKSLPDKGTTFTIILPAALAVEQAP